MEYNAANVERVVRDFYRAGSAGGSAAGHHEWLTKAQLSPEAWNFAWQLISPERDPEVQFFGANTLAMKVRKCFHEISESDFPLLQNKLMTLFREYFTRGPKMVLTRLGVAVASLMISACGSSLWRRPVDDQLNLMQSDLAQSGMAVLPAFLELLTLVPEEFATQVMPSARRAAIRADLSESLPRVLDMVVQLFRESAIPVDAVRQGVKCLQAWVQFGIPIEATEKILELLVTKLGDEELLEPCLEVMSSIISHPESHNHPHALRRIIPRLLSLEPLLTKMMGEGLYDEATPLASLFVAVGEAHSRLLLDWSTESLEGRQHATKLVSIVLSISSCQAQYPTQERLSDMPFGFWYIFQDDIIACDPPQYQQCVSVYGPAYHNLVESLLKKSMMPLSYDNWTSDQKEVFRCYRTDVADCIMYCHNILRDDLLRLLNHHMDEAVTMCRGEGHARHWPYLETCLYSWAAIGESMAEEEENPLLVQFLAKLATVPFGGQLPVITATLDCIGGFAEWLGGYPALVASLVPVVTSAVGDPQLSMSATMALKDLARDCPDALQPCSRQVITACAEALASRRLKPSECVRLMYPIGKMISFLPPEEVLREMEAMLAPYLVELETAVSSATQDKAQALFVLKMVTTLFQSLDAKPSEKAAAASASSSSSGPNQPPPPPRLASPIATLLNRVLPLADAASKTWYSDEEAMDAIYLLLKQSSACLVSSNSNLTARMVEFLHNSFGRHPHSTAFDVSRQLVSVHLSDGQFQPILVGLLSSMAERSIAAAQSVANPSELSDLLASLFQNMAQTLKKNPYFFAPSAGAGLIDTGALFNCACATLHLPESGTVKYAANFFVALSAAATTDNPTLSQVVHAGGLNLVKTAIVCLSKDLTSSHLDHVTEVFSCLNKCFFAEWSNWLAAFAADDSSPFPGVPREKKEEFARLILRERANKRKMLEVTKDFAATCIRLRGAS